MSDLCTVKKSTLDGIAEAIQSKTGESGGMLPSEMKGKIEDLPSQPAKGLVFSEYDSEGYPHKAEFVGSWTEIPAGYADGVFSRSLIMGKNVSALAIPEGVTVIQNSAIRGIHFTPTLPSTLVTLNNNCFQNSTFSSITLPSSLTTINSFAFQENNSLTSITFPAGLTTTNQNCFGNCRALATVTYLGNVPNISSRQYGNTPITLFDCSHATAIPSLYAVNALDHASGCVIRIPSALSDQTLGAGNGWESATNWSGLTNIVWEAV